MRVLRRKRLGLDGSEFGIGMEEEGGGGQLGEGVEGGGAEADVQFWAQAGMGGGGMGGGGEMGGIEGYGGGMDGGEEYGGGFGAFLLARH